MPYPKNKENPRGNMRVRIVDPGSLYYMKLPRDPATGKYLYDYPDWQTYPQYRTTKHMPCALDAGQITPITEYATAALYKPLDFGLIDECIDRSSNLRKFAGGFDEQITFFGEAGKVAVMIRDVINPVAGGAGPAHIWLEPWVDPDTTALHPFDMVLTDTADNAIMKLVDPLNTTMGPTITAANPAFPIGLPVWGRYISTYAQSQYQN